ncbi:membrane protein [Gordonia phage Neville]|uniref:Uncharacterized protein n=2 Tax=Nevillevirus TaxID=3044773 RepID=A0A515MH87_9CAUD|nr:membrane protein [Gordonia phage Neville]YP_010246022.1 hypothetical protein L3Y20_gp037 [Gordonia phage Trax]AXQ64409.1 membrane protein [Gordonia phage Neville]QDM55924.1 hypothetical protein SEA_TRAX_37 [Gordonia phage Trax]
MTAPTPEVVDLVGGGWPAIIFALGMLAAAAATGFIRYLVKKTNQLQSDYDTLRQEFESMKEESRKQEERHRQDRERDYLLITALQNKLVALQVYIATLRGMLAERGIVSPDPPAFREDPDVIM